MMLVVLLLSVFFGGTVVREAWAQWPAEEKAVVSGRVVDADGKPVAKASVEVWAIESRSSTGVRTDEEGYFNTKDKGLTKSRTYTIEIKPSVDLPVKGKATIVSDDKEVAVPDLKVEAVRVFEVRVVDRANKPADGARVQIYGQGIEPRVESLTNKDGVVRGTGLMPKGAVYISVDKDSHGAKFETDAERFPAGPITLTLVPSYVLAVALEFPASVEVAKVKGRVNFVSVKDGKTKFVGDIKDGRFRAYLDEGEYTVDNYDLVKYGVYIPAATKITADGNKEVRVEVKPLPTVKVALKGNAEKVKNVELVLLYVHGAFASKTDDKGVAEFKVPPGPYRVRHQKSQLVPIFELVHVDEKGTPIEVAVSEGVRLRGSVVDSSQKPMGDAVVRAMWNVSDPRSGVTKQDGTFEVGLLPEGPMYFLVRHPTTATNLHVVAALKPGVPLKLVQEAGRDTRIVLQNKSAWPGEVRHLMVIDPASGVVMELLPLKDGVATTRLLDKDYEFAVCTAGQVLATAAGRPRDGKLELTIKDLEKPPGTETFEWQVFKSPKGSGK